MNIVMNDEHIMNEIHSEMTLQHILKYRLLVPVITTMHLHTIRNFTVIIGLLLLTSQIVLTMHVTFTLIRPSWVQVIETTVHTVTLSVVSRMNMRLLLYTQLRF